MNEVVEFLQKLLDLSDFPPRWHCGRWSSFHGWLYIISDIAIWGAYFAIPVIILRYVARKYDARYVKLYFLFAAFILACGSTHLLDALMFWYPYYRISALFRFTTAIISWLTVFSLVKELPLAFSQKTASQLEIEIEKRKQYEQQLIINNKLLQEAQEIARLGHWQWDVTNNIVEWSDMTLRLYGLPAEERNMNYQSYLSKLHPDDKAYVDQAVMQAFSEKVFPRFYHRIILPNGQIRVLLSKGEVLLNTAGEVVKMIGTVQDITEQKNTEHELLLKSQRLEATNEELQKFASIASHDLREPLRKIITFGSMLEKNLGENLEEKNKLLLYKITSASARMQKLIDDVLDFSRLTVNNHFFEKVDLNDLISEVLNDMEVSIEKTGATILYNNLPEVDANYSQLGQLFQNLLGNGIKFRKPGIAPLIRITADIVNASALPESFIRSQEYNFAVVRNPELINSERFCRITVADNGIGFDETYLDKIFLIFQRLHDKAEYEGTGIGLAVCKKVVNLHNGYITAFSHPGQGATFVIYLPMLQHAANAVDEHNQLPSG